MNLVLQTLLDKKKIKPSKQFVDFSDFYVSAIYDEIKKYRPDFIEVYDVPGKEGSKRAQIIPHKEKEIKEFLDNEGFINVQWKTGDAPPFFK